MLPELDHEDDWDSEEMQTALKIVLKYEIQSLLERLSQQGEETVLLTANRVDNCVGHLASSNALRFVDSKDVGDLKVKFLTFLTVPHEPTDQYYGPTGANKNIGTKGSAVHTESELKARTLSIDKPSLDKTGKQVMKRPLEDGSASKDKVGPQTVDPKRRKLDSSDGIPAPQLGAKNANVLPQAKPGQKGEMKLNTTKVVSKSGFVEERLSAADFQKFLQQYKPMPETEGNEEDYDEEIYDEEEEEGDYSELLEEGEIRFPYSQQAQMYQQKQSGQKQLQTVNISVSNSVNAIINVNKGVVTKPTPKSQEAVKKIGEVGIGDKGKNLQQNVGVRYDTGDKTKPVFVTPNSSRTKQILGATGKVSEIKGPEVSSDKEQDGDNKLTKKDGETNDKTKQVQRPSETVKTDKDMNNTKKTVQAAAASTGNKGSFDGNVDEMDTEALIKMVKAQHAQSQSDADKQIQEKLGKLSSKLSWVVEYPSQKEGQAMPGQSGQNMNPNQCPGFPQGTRMLACGMDGEYDDEDEEEYDEDEDFDEDELDEHELEALAYMRKMNSSAMPPPQPPPPPPQTSQHFEGEIGDEEYDEDYDQEMEEFDNQHRVYNPMGEEIKMTEFGGVDAESSEDQGYSVYQRSASPSIENYLMIGAVMAKCLVCNKIVRKSEVKQHNKLHDEEEYEEEEGDEGGEDGGEAGYMEEGEEFHGEREGLEENEERFEGEESYQEEEYVDDGEEDLNMAEFTAQPLIAEKIDTQQLDTVSGKKGSKKSEQKSTVCDICNKTFKSNTNMIRHRKIHTDSSRFFCPVCNKSFRLQIYLSKHMKKLHPDYEGQQAGDGDGGAIAQDGGAEEETEQKPQS